ncbi:methylamine utilization protein [Acidovorax facilis]|jgi:plastocyanin|uniref:methylamine utilization protein n=1 Tax=Acidovorax facilis TaxID=12917 RepID=UPI003D649868
MTTSCHAQRTRALSALTGVVVVFVACLAGLPTAAHAATVQVEVLDAAGRPLPDAVVFLESADARKAVKPLSGAEMAQEKRQFVPGLLVVPVGTEVRFPNHDSVRHHVYSFSPAKKFELKLYTGTPSNPVLFDRPGVAVLGCNIHDQMVGWIVVVDTPYYARTPAAPGRAQIDNVPPGTYTLRTWHTRLPVGAPAQEQALTVPATGAAAASVRLAGLQP